jgi:hypothetical protein
MKKIIIPFEGPNYPEVCLELVHRMNEIAPIRLTAVFAPEVDYSQLWSLTGGMAGAVYLPDLGDEDQIVAETSRRLQDFCKKNSIQLFQHKERLDFALALIRKETRFAELLMLDGQQFFANIDARQPNAYMKELLHTAECPILLLPEEADIPAEIVLTYDGSASSVFAIKQFIHVFPEFLQLPTTLVYLCPSKNEPFPDKENIEELAAAHFGDLRLLELHLDPQEFFFDWLPAHKGSWLVTGSFGRSDVSQLFSKSFVTALVRDHRTTVFTAHR